MSVEWPRVPDSAAWPRVPDAESVFPMCLMFAGPPPEKWWKTTKYGKYPVTGTPASTWHQEVIGFFRKEVNRVFPRKYTSQRREMLARKWKNEFYLWLWKEIDEASGGDSGD